MSTLAGIQNRAGEEAGGRRAKIAGCVAICVTVLIWAGFALSIRHIGASALTVADVALIRFGVPTLLLLPFLPSRWQALRAVRPGDAFMVIAGAGLPFFFIASAGGAATSATYVGALVAGTAPLSVAVISRLLDGHFHTGTRWPALAVIAAGATALIMASPARDGADALSGSALLLGASLLWGAYTLGLRRAGLDAVGSTLLLAAPSLAGLLLLMATGVVSSHLGHVSMADASVFLIAQGLGVGFVASLAYVVAIRRLGAARSAVIGSLAPALACLLAVPLLGEQLTPSILIGVVAITLGVIFSNRP